MNAVEGSDRVRPVGADVRAPGNEAERKPNARGRRGRGRPGRERPAPPEAEPGHRVDLRMP